MKKQNKNSLNWLTLASLVLITLFTFSCEEAEDDVTKEEDNTEENNDGSSTANLDNNTITDGTASTSLDKYSMYLIEGEVNTGKDYYELLAITEDDLTLSENYLRISFHQPPTAAKTYSWQESGNSGGALTPDEFILDAKIDGQTWSGVFTSEAWSTTGSLEATLDGDNLTLAFSEIELSDNFISINVTETKKISGKITIDVNAGLSSGRDYFDLID